MLAKLDSFQEEMKTNQTTADANQAEILARTEAIQEEIIAKMDTHQERMGASANAWRTQRPAKKQQT
jgi:hypothetical protein